MVRPTLSSNLIDPPPDRLATIFVMFIVSMRVFGSRVVNGNALLSIGLQHKRADLDHIRKLYRAPAADALAVNVNPVRRSRIFNRHAAVVARKAGVMIRNL